MDPYFDLGNSLDQKGIPYYMQNADLLVISASNPGWPGSNCFWVTFKQDACYIGTWLPAVYELAANANVSNVCECILNSSPTAAYLVDTQLAAQLGLRRLSAEEIEKHHLA